MNVRYSLIYRFFAVQIRSGHFRTGDQLPSIEELCSIYHVSIRTVRSAYLQLQEDGYITLSPGRRTTVVYASTPEVCNRQFQRYYMARKAAIQPLTEALQLLLLPLLQAGCGRLSAHVLYQIRETAARLESGDFYISYFGGRAMLLALKNRLALDLFDAVVFFYQFPHILLRFPGHETEAQGFRVLVGRTVSACDRGDREAFSRAYFQIQTYMNQVLSNYIGLAEQLLPAQEQVPFDWEVYRERPQRCYSMAARLIGQIYFFCAFRPGDALPCHAALAQQYQVSYMTVRRTMELLESLGAVSVRQGAGTTVVRLRPDPDRLGDRTLRKLHTMAAEALEILRCALDGIAARFCLGTAERARACAELLRAQQSAGLRTPALLICVDFLLRGGGNPPLERIWDKLCEVLLLDLPLLEAAAADLSIGPEALLRSLEAGDSQAFHGALLAQLQGVCEAAEVLGRQIRDH